MTRARPAYIVIVFAMASLLASTAVAHDPHDHAMANDQHVHDHNHVHDHEAHWLGRLHPPSVHFPIGLLIAALVAEGLFAATGQARFAAASWFCAWAGVVMAWIAAVLGWLFGGFDLAADDRLFATHRWLGTATAAWTLVLLWVLLRARTSETDASRTLYRLTLTVAALLVAATGFFGGALVWGWDHYTLQ